MILIARSIRSLGSLAATRHPSSSGSLSRAALPLPSSSSSCHHRHPHHHLVTTLSTSPPRPPPKGASGSGFAPTG
ncbi:hypothetical protein Tco_1535823, partial [Tanacetum coccineum]